MGAPGSFDNTYFDDSPKVADVLSQGGIEGSFTVGTTALSLKVGASILEGRKSLTLLNNSNVTMYWGYTNAVTTSTGTPIFKNQFVTWSVADSQPVYIIAGTAGNNARITEAG